MGLPDPDRDPQFYAGVPLRRFFAFVVDTIVTLVIMSAVGMVIALLGVLTLGVGFLAMPPAFALVAFLYRFTMLRERSATLGMLLAGIELRGPTGARLDGPLAAVHTLAFLATLFIPILLLIGAALMVFNPRRQMLHDLPLGTAMINRPE
ncbi:RDD family protein [Limibaculum sp. M0105]|uniref:RDD family protein n=1 Tax=Thermohalobaculum xanthum TaxID=2753746 RepID=A0A8J7SCX9_9RHOB|nr:RDD family protein [Thermohalobaculum xanthum]MBK0398923.1 RDD family protein [Thermohalobaculum xanthum]